MNRLQIDIFVSYLIQMYYVILKFTDISYLFQFTIKPFRSEFHL